MTENYPEFRLAFVCVRNAGRSQMATTFAKDERERRSLNGQVEIVTGGTHPADAVHPEVVGTMRALGFDLSKNEPRSIDPAALADCDLVVTMGCSTLDLPEGVKTREWALADPAGKDPDTVATVRDEIRGRVYELFEELEAGFSGRPE